MFNPGDGVIVLGDGSSHGGQVISATGYYVNGKQVALVGDLVACPKTGHGVCPIVEGHPTITVSGKSVAFHGCHTACGASLLSSQGGYHCLGSDTSTSIEEYPAQTPHLSSTRLPEVPDQKFDRFIQIKDENEQPVVDVIYSLVKKDGTVISGKTDSHGKTKKLTSANADAATFFIGIGESHDTRI